MQCTQQLKYLWTKKYYELWAFIVKWWTFRKNPFSYYLDDDNFSPCLSHLFRIKRIVCLWFYVYTTTAPAILATLFSILSHCLVHFSIFCLFVHCDFSFQITCSQCRKQDNCIRIGKKRLLRWSYKVNESKGEVIQKNIGSRYQILKTRRWKEK